VAQAKAGQRRARAGADCAAQFHSKNQGLGLGCPGSQPLIPLKAAGPRWMGHPRKAHVTKVAGADVYLAKGVGVACHPGEPRPGLDLMPVTSVTGWAN
jgi:hypothetical protein